MKKLSLLIIGLVLCASLSAAAKGKSFLKFDSSAGEKQTLTMPDGTTVDYTAYTRLYYVTNVEDSVYQFLNVFVPEGATQSTPIFLRTYVGGYMASAAGMPQAEDASGRALKEGYVLVIPGTRGRNSTVQKDGKAIYTGRAPKAIVDLNTKFGASPPSLTA